MKHCFYCDEPLQDDAVFCSGCGKTTEYTHEILDRAAGGDYRVQHELFNRTQKDVMREISSRITDKQQAGKIFQKTYVLAFKHLSGLQNPAAFPDWLLAATRRMVDMTLNPEEKSQPPKKAPDLSPAEEPAPAAPAEPPLEREQKAEPAEPAKAPRRVRTNTNPEIEALLDGLPEDQREVLDLAYYDNMNMQDIGTTLGISQADVRIRMFQARAVVNRKLHSAGADGGEEITSVPSPQEEPLPGPGESDPGIRENYDAAAIAAQVEEDAAREELGGNEEDLRWGDRESLDRDFYYDEEASSPTPRVSQGSRRARPEQRKSSKATMTILLTAVAAVVVACIVGFVLFRFLG